ncbi:hypothetical protein ABK040_008967 [Willaertia magna]
MCLEDASCLSTGDFIVIICYFVFILLLGIITGCWGNVQKIFKKYILVKKPENQQVEQLSTKDETTAYFLADKNSQFWAIGASLYASNIGSEHIIGLMGSGASEGMAVGWYEWMAVFILFLLGYVFTPVYLKSKVFTTPEYIEKRFHPFIRSYLAFLSLIIYIFTKISVTLYAVSLVFGLLFKLNVWISCLIVLVSTGVYTVIGGLKAVIYTEVIQTVVLIVGTIVLTIISVNSVGGLSKLMELAPDKFHLFKSIYDSDFPWIGVIFGVPILGIHYWLTDQVIVQRVLSAKNLGNAQSGTVIAAGLKITPMLFLVLPGIVAFTLYPKEINEQPDHAFILLTVSLLPTVIKGLIISSLLAAAMSSIASVFNSATTIFTMDIYHKIRKNASQHELVIVGKVSALLLVILSVLWVPFIQNMNNQVYLYTNAVCAYLAPPITSLFLIGLLWPGATSIGGITSLIIGLIVGLVRFILEIFFKSSPVITNYFLFIFVKLNFLVFAIGLFWLCAFIFVTVSLLTPQKYRKTYEEVEQYCFDWKVFVRLTKKLASFSFTKRNSTLEEESRKLEETRPASSTPLSLEEQLESNKDSNEEKERAILKVTGIHKYSWIGASLVGLTAIGLIIYFR